MEVGCADCFRLADIRQRSIGTSVHPCRVPLSSSSTELCRQPRIRHQTKINGAHAE
jgi:hypothetical protein